MATWDLSATQHHVLICNGGSCMKSGGEEVTQAIRAEITALGLDREIHTTRTRCNGRCSDSCVVIAYPAGIWYKEITPEAGLLVVRHLIEKTSLESHVSYSFINNQLTAALLTDKGVQK
jgi:(2Fe-2S) ferredoxin